FLVETDWLAAHLDDPNLIVLDGTVHLIPDPKITYTVTSGREDFEKGHIPGAQFVDLQADLSAPHRNLRFMLPTAEAAAAAMARCARSARSPRRSMPAAAATYMAGRAASPPASMCRRPR